MKEILTRWLKDYAEWGRIPQWSVKDNDSYIYGPSLLDNGPDRPIATIGETKIIFWDGTSIDSKDPQFLQKLKNGLLDCNLQFDRTKIEIIARSEEDSYE